MGCAHARHTPAQPALRLLTMLPTLPLLTLPPHPDVPRRIPSDGNKARYIEKPNGCQPTGVNSNTGEPCVYTSEMRRWDYFKKVVSVPSTSQTAGKFDFSGFKDGDLWVALITFL